MTKDPGFTLRGRFEGRNVVLRWRDGELVEAPGEIRSAVARMITDGRWVRRELAHPWHFEGEATMADRWLCQEAEQPASQVQAHTPSCRSQGRIRGIMHP